MKCSSNTLHSVLLTACVLAIGFAGGHALFAQTPPPPPTEPAAAPAKLTIDVNEAVQKARTLIESIDSNLADAPSRETLQELEKLIEDIQTADPAHPWLTYLLGRAYGLAGRNGDAIDQLRKFVQTRDGRNDWRAHQVLGDMFVGEFPRLAQGSYEKAAELNPNEPSVLTGLSNCANRAGNLDEGIRLARLAVAADGYNNVRYPHRLARALMARKQFDEAEKEAMKALSIAEDRVQKNPGKRVSLQIFVEQFSLLIELMSARILAATTVDPQAYIRFAELTGVRADIMNRLAKHDQVAILESAVTKTGPDTPIALRQKYAAYLVEAGRTDDAIAEYEKIIAAEPGQKDATEALAQLKSAKDIGRKSSAP
jgi:tetratricopeptide (TPR) repeat protein